MTSVLGYGLRCLIYTVQYSVVSISTDDRQNTSATLLREVEAGHKVLIKERFCQNLN